uniref:E9 protein n=1 Tax=Reindeer papillomavirus TaxID=10569 RepID=Q86835_PAPVR|nr:transforming gene [Reindeer papillomavirus]
MKFCLLIFLLLLFGQLNFMWVIILFVWFAFLHSLNYT